MSIDYPPFRRCTYQRMRIFGRIVAGPLSTVDDHSFIDRTIDDHYCLVVSSTKKWREFSISLARMYELDLNTVRKTLRSFQNGLPLPIMDLSLAAEYSTMCRRVRR